MRPGSVVADRFELQKAVGAGAMGVVYRAWDRVSKQVVALKILKDDSKRFEAEARALEDASHPGIVRYLAHGTTPDGERYLAMEWLEGEDLCTRLSRGPLSLDETLALGERVGRGLGVAHAKDILHRDIKPANVFLPDRDPSAAKVLDFGIARHADVTGATRSGTIVGTVGYMSPEQVMARDDLDARSDVFSLACVLYECLTGTPAFEGELPMAVMAKVLIDPQRRVREVLPSAPAAVDDLIARMLSKKREDRPRDGSDVADRIAALRARTDAASPGGPARPAPDRGGATATFVGLARPADPLPQATSVALQESIARAGGQLFVLRDGGLVVTVAGVGDVAEEATRAARCALVLEGGVHAPMALSTASSLGEAVDRAATLLATPMSARGGVRVDDATASLLAGRVAVTKDSTSSLIGADTVPDGDVGSAPTVEAPFDSMVGRTLAHYAISARLGQGGMGVVYRAHDDKLHRDVALKLLPPERMRDERRRKRFVREARLLAAVTHPNIAAVYEIGEAEGVVYIAMELVAGKTIREMLSDGPIEPGEALRIAREIAQGLAKAHGAGVVHRDLKPDNVMVSADGHVKVLDFGLSKALGAGTGEEPAPKGEKDPLVDADRPSAIRTHAGELLGTPAYMSPEQAQGTGDDPRTDVFAFGATVFEMLTGRRAFEGRTADEVLARVMVHTPPPVSSQDRRVPREIDPFLSRCLAKRAAVRPASGAELVEALERIVPRPRPPSLFAEALYNVGLPVLAVLVVAFLSTLAFALWKRSTVSSARSSETASPLSSPGSVVACPVFEAAGVPEPSGWLGAAAADMACERARVILGGRAERTQAPAELLELARRSGDEPGLDPYGAPGARARSLAAARTRASVLLDGKVVVEGSRFAVWLSLRGKGGRRLSRGAGRGRSLVEAIREAMDPLVASGRLPKSRSLDPGVAEGRASSVDAALSLLDDDLLSTDPPPADAGEEELLLLSRRAFLLSREDTGVAARLGGLLLRAGRPEEARGVALDLATGGRRAQVSGDVLLARVDASERRLAAALDRWMRAARVEPGDGPGVVAARAEAARRALRIASVLERRGEVAVSLFRRFLEPDPPPVSADEGTDLHGWLAAVCDGAHDPSRSACFARLAALRGRGFFRGVPSETSAFVAGAERHAAGDFRGAADRWRPLVVGGEPIVELLPEAMSETFERVGEDELAERIDERDLSGGAELAGATLANVRIARRAARRGDQARATAMARQVVEAWSGADVGVPAVVEMERLLERLGAPTSPRR